MSDSEDDDRMETDVDAGPELLTEGDICGDGSILKTIIRPGTGTITATRGAQCSVHYVGTLLDGTKFDSSRDRSEPFEFTIGQGVITGWSEGVSTMKTGELATFTIQSHKAYGKGGSGKIPPDATLVFEIELLHWTNLEDVSVKHDKSVFKATTAKGEGFNKPKALSAATIHFTITLDDGTLVHDTNTGEPVHIIVDDGDIATGFDELIKTLKKNEEASYEIKASKAFGSSGSSQYHVPPHANIKGQIKLLDFTTPKNSWDMSTQEKFEAAEALKNEGNNFFKSGAHAKALRRYKAAVDFFSSASDLPEDERAKAEALTTSCYLNQAASQLKTRSFRDAITSCGKVLETDKNNVKALFRSGTAKLELGEWDDAQKDFQRVVALDSGNKEAHDSLKKIAQLKAEQTAKDRKLYAKMFA